MVEKDKAVSILDTNAGTNLTLIKLVYFLNTQEFVAEYVKMDNESIVNNIV